MTVTEPPHASLWQAVRDACIGYSGDEWCAYPWCKCAVEEAGHPMTLHLLTGEERGEG